jgi:Zn finger protein HypA/HybF involved in hydrogenase expression
MILPHPIQSEGGEIYTLPCDRCGSRIPVVDLEGTVACEHCGQGHAIVQGDGYLTIRPV